MYVYERQITYSTCLFAVVLCFVHRALIGELDEEIDSRVDLGNVRAAPLKAIVH